MPSNSDQHIRPLLPHRLSPVESISALAVERQIELYSSQRMNEPPDWFAPYLNWSLDFETFTKDVAIQDDLLDPFWLNFFEWWSFETTLTASQTRQLELHILSGIPLQLRPRVYMHVMQVRQKLLNKNTLDLLYSKYASLAENLASIDMVDFEPDMKKVFAVAQYLLSGSDHTDNTNRSLAVCDSQMECREPNSFVVHAAKLIAAMPGLENEQQLCLILKLNKVFIKLDKDEFLYKVNRSLEDYSLEFFRYLSTQGCDLYCLYTKILYTSFAELITDQSELLKILDLIVFEGFTVILRLIVFFFAEHEVKIMNLSGTDVVDYLNSVEFYLITINWEKVLEILPHLIKYENEYYLIHANSFNKNNNELKNLKEINNNLKLQVREHELKFKELMQSHHEIILQSKELNMKLHEELETQQRLAKTRASLQTRHDDLTMKQNVINTRKANKEFSRRNEELAQIVALMKQRIILNKSKLEKSTSLEKSLPVD